MKLSYEEFFFLKRVLFNIVVPACKHLFNVNNKCAAWDIILVSLLLTLNRYSSLELLKWCSENLSAKVLQIPIFHDWIGLF